MIAKKRSGVSVKEIIDQSDDFSRGGRITQKLEDLKRAGFILPFKSYSNKRKGTFYRVVDECI